MGWGCSISGLNIICILNGWSQTKQHIVLEDSAPSCFDIVSDQPNLAMSSVVRSLMNPFERHLITLCNLM